MICCRACGSAALEQVVDFGWMPLAGDFHSGAKAGRFPLVIDHCLTCDVLQVRDLVPHEILFNKSYCYASSTVPALVEHFKSLALEIQSLLALTQEKEKQQVLEIGSNDGVLLRELDKLGIESVGADASGNVVQQAQRQGCAAVELVFSSKTATSLKKYAPAGYSLVTCSNVFAHNEDPSDILSGIKLVLKPGGWLIIEVHDSGELYKTLQWDCFYHEHCFYWSSTALFNILKANGFIVEGFAQLAMHGGALRVVARMPGGPAAPDLGLCKVPTTSASWKQFGVRTQRSAEVLNDVLSCVLEARDGIFLLGAAGRAATLIHYAGIASILDGAFDGSPLRIGKRVPGTDIPIHDEATLPNFGPAPYLLLGAWHLEKQLVAKVKSYKLASPTFITPLPSVKLF